jgi:hypothetical protein
MRRLVASLAGLSLLVAISVVPSAAFAKAENAAVTDRGKGCLVADANGAYTLDPNCDYHIVTRNQGGALVRVSYQDQGNLPEGAPRPTSARRAPVSAVIGGQTCEGEETTTPSGRYHSNCHFNASN